MPLKNDKFGKMQLSFSVAKPDLADLLTVFVNSAYRGESSRLGWTTEADLLDGQRTDPAMISSMIETPDSLILLAHDVDAENKIVGCVHLEKQALTDHTDPVCHLGLLTVKPTLQSVGIGRSLLKECESWARSWKCKEIQIDVLAPRRELVDWYSRRGYELTGEKKNFYYGDTRYGLPKRKDLTLLILRKKI